MRSEAVPAGAEGIGGMGRKGLVIMGVSGRTMGDEVIDELLARVLEESALIL